jgi:hypothetical protein
MATIEAPTMLVPGDRARQAARKIYDSLLDEINQDLIKAAIGKLAYARSDYSTLALVADLHAAPSSQNYPKPFLNIETAMKIPNQDDEYGVLLPLERQNGSPAVKIGDLPIKAVLPENGLVVVKEFQLPRNLNGHHVKHDVAVFGVAASLQHMSALRYGSQ